MKTRFLGNTGVRVSELCLGAMTFGGKGYWMNIGQVEQKEANDLVTMAIAGGINFFDTADVYSEGRSEEILGKALGSKRKDIVLATKVRGRTGAAERYRPFTKAHYRFVRGESEETRNRVYRFVPGSQFRSPDSA